MSELLSKPAPGRSWNWLRRTLRPTSWRMIRTLRAQHSSSPPAWEEFFRGYWYPLYSFLRQSGYAGEEARDYTQSFLIDVREADLLAAADPARGRLWNFLLTLLTRHVSKQRRRAAAAKRGGGVPTLSLDWHAAEAAWQLHAPSTGSPEEAYRRSLAERLVADAIAQLSQKYKDPVLFDMLLPSLEGPLPDETYADVAAKLGMKPPAVRTAATRMKERFRRALCAAAAPLLGIPEGPLLDAELRAIFAPGAKRSGT